MTASRQVDLRSKTKLETLQMVENLPADLRAHVSEAWLQSIRELQFDDPWHLGFAIVLRADCRRIGQCGFKGPPVDQAVEIAYQVDENEQGKGYATEAVGLLVEHAFSSEEVRQILAHTLPESNASTRVLEKNGFAFVSDVQDPEDGLIWCWQLQQTASTR
ncbi:MAG: GNAT family N-acetyltransferase [Planctomycetota bacterium]